MIRVCRRAFACAVDNDKRRVLADRGGKQEQEIEPVDIFSLIGLVLAVVAVFALIAITPLCGFMFDCGCDWPWNGLHHHCNVFDADAKLKCPWCDSKVAGSLSMLAVFGVSAAAAWWVSASGALAGASARARFTLGVVTGVLAFHLVSLGTATLAALATGYPLPFTA